MAGRKPIPTMLKLIRGNPGRRPLPEGEPKPIPILPDPPKYLRKDVRAIWFEWRHLLYRNGVLTELDIPAFSALCHAEADFRKNTDIESKIRNELDKRRRGWFTEFGMTPSSRSRVKAAPKAEKKMEGADYFGWAEEK